MNTTIALLLSLQLGAVAVGGEPDAAAQPEAVEGIKGADLELLGEVRRIAGNVERLREQSFDRPPIAVRVQEPMREVAATIRAYGVLSPERLEARGRAWADLGLGDERTPETLLRVLATDLDDVAFDPSANRLLVSPRRLTVEDFAPEGADDPTTVLLMTGVRPDEPLVSHLLAHVRQRERLGGDPLQGTTDELLAGMAWAEGEANLVAVRYLFEGMGISDAILEHRVDPGELLDGALLPGTLAELSAVDAALVAFVYLDGFDHAVAAFLEGGWPALDRAMARRGSTRQFLHPERGAPNNEWPQSEPPGEGFLRVDRDTLGEQAIVALISHNTGKDNLGLLAGDGWAGGRVQRWERPGNPADGVTDWVTRWDSAAAADDFGYSFARALSARYPDGKWIERGPHSRRFDGAGRTFLLDAEATEVRVRVWPTALAPAPPAALRVD